jgi:ATP synthase protein I
MAGDGMISRRFFKKRYEGLMNDLNELEKRLNEAKARHESLNPKPKENQYGKEMSAGIRAFMEMIGVLLGSGLMGYALDAAFKTTPTLLIIFIVLGIVTSIFNLFKLSKNLGTSIGSNSLQSGDKMDRKSPENET